MYKTGPPKDGILTSVAELVGAKVWLEPEPI